MVEVDDTTSASTRALHRYASHKNEQEMLLQRVGPEVGELSHSSRSGPFASQPLSYDTLSVLSCSIPGRVKCLDPHAVSCLMQGGYHGGGCVSLQPVRSASASSEVGGCHGGGCGCVSLQPVRSASGLSQVFVSCSRAATDEVALGLANGLPRKRNFDEISQVSRRFRTGTRKTSRIADIIDASGSAVCIDRASTAKGVVQKKDGCKESQLEAEDLSNVFYNESSTLPHSEKACSEPSSEALEAILCNLQKKDTYGVFSKPVDAMEVPGYYDVIKEPMDFGTIRSKLLKGTYVTLDLFKKDVYLICSNAMRFNGPKTIYFKQARSIQDAARRALNSLARQVRELNDYSKLRNKRRTIGAKHFPKSLSTQSNNQPKNVDDRVWATQTSANITGYKNGAITMSNPVQNRVGKNREEDIRSKGVHGDQFQSSGREKESPSFEHGTSLRSLKCSSFFEDCRSSYQPSSCRAALSEDVQQLFATGCQQQHAYARSLAYFGASLKFGARKYVARKIQKALAPHKSSNSGWVVRKDSVAAATLIDDVDPLKIKCNEPGESRAGVPGLSDGECEILVCSLPCAADAACTSILPRNTKLSPVTSAVTEASPASSVLTRADPQCQSTGSNIQVQPRTSSSALKQSDCGASQDTSTLLSACPTENHPINSDTIGDRQQLETESTAAVSFESSRKGVNYLNESSRVLKNTSNLFPCRLTEIYRADTQQGGRNTTDEKDCQESNKQEVYCANQLLQLSESATVLKEETMAQREEAFAQNLPAPICKQLRGSFWPVQWNTLGQRANSILDFPAPGIINVERGLSWHQMQIQGRSFSMSSESCDQRASDVPRLPQNPAWGLEPHTQISSNIYVSPEGTYPQSEPLHLPYFAVSKPTNQENYVPNSNLLAVHRHLQSASGSLCYPWNPTSQKSVEQIGPPFFMSDNLTPCMQFPMAPQGLTLTSQQPNLALQL